MQLRVVYSDSLFYHPRTIFVCKWNKQYNAWVQWPIASTVAITKIGAELWTNRKMLQHLEHAKTITRMVEK